LRDFDDPTCVPLSAAAAAGTVVFTTAFEPTEAQRESLRAAASEALGAPVEAVFEREAALLAGVTLRAGDLRVGWSVRAHVDELERAWRGPEAPHDERAEAANGGAGGGAVPAGDA
jgi:hypothetical protein